MGYPVPEELLLNSSCVVFIIQPNWCEGAAENPIPHQKASQGREGGELETASHLLLFQEDHKVLFQDSDQQQFKPALVFMVLQDTFKVVRWHGRATTPLQFLGLWYKAIDCIMARTPLNCFPNPQIGQQIINNSIAPGGMAERLRPDS